MGAGISRHMEDTIRKLYPMPVILVVEEWVDSHLTHVDDGGEDDVTEVAPEGSFCDGAIYLCKQDADRLKHWMDKGYRIRAIINKP